MKIPEKSEEKYLKKTIAAYQPYSKEKLTQDDAAEINRNMTGFFRLLMKWKEKETQEEIDTLLSEVNNNKIRQ